IGRPRACRPRPQSRTSRHPSFPGSCQSMDGYSGRMSESDKAPDVPPAPTYTYGQPAPPPPAAAPAPPQQPRYGEYAPPGYVPPAPPPGTAFAPVAPVAPAGRRRRMWDVVLTIVLLVIGFFGMGIGILYGAVIGDRAVLDATFQSLGLDGFSGT